MKNLIDAIIEKPPGCIAKFSSLRVNITLPTTWNTGPEFITQLLGCHCGHSLFYIETDLKKELRGVCSKTEVVTACPPVYAVCSKCRYTALIFDPIIHGWNGEMGITHESESALRLAKYKAKPGLVYVNYSYRNIENYKTLLVNGVQGIENYFDTFTVLYSDSHGESITEITSSVCV